MAKTVRSKKKNPKMTYSFGASVTEGRSSQKDLLGGKGANLADMTSIGLPVPPGFTIPTTMCEAYIVRGERLPRGLMIAVKAAVRRVDAVACGVGKSRGGPSAA